MQYEDWTQSKRWLDTLEEEVKQGLDDYKAADEPRTMGWIYEDGAHITVEYSEHEDVSMRVPSFTVTVGNDGINTGSLAQAERFLWYTHSQYNYDDVEHTFDDDGRCEPHITF